MTNLRRAAAWGILLAAQPLSAQVGVREAALARVPLARALAADAQLLEAVRAKNAKAESEAEIRRLDAEWTRDASHALRGELSRGACADRLRELTKADPNVVEVILMDRNGANVCISRETSDYWQGDEPKFQKTFGQDKELHVDEPALDQSTGVYAIQLSVLVRDGGQKAGALTLGLRVRKQQQPDGR
jgi:hypothetical protein